MLYQNYKKQAKYALLRTYHTIIESTQKKTIPLKKTFIFH